jgi:hypothetical protein
MNTKSSNDVMAEVAGAAWRWKLFLEQKRSEIHEQIARVQGSGTALDPTPTGVMPAPLPMMPHVPGWDSGVPDGSGEGSSEREEESPDSPDRGQGAPTGSEIPAIPPPDAGTTLDPSAARDTPAEATPEGARVSEKPDPSRKASVNEAQTRHSIDLPTLEEALSAGVVATLPTALHEALRDRKEDEEPPRWIRMLVAATAETWFPAEVVGVVKRMTEVDSAFREANRLFVSGKYPDLYDFDWGPPGEGAAEGAKRHDEVQDASG